MSDRVLEKHRLQARDVSVRCERDRCLATKTAALAEQSDDDLSNALLVGHLNQRISDVCPISAGSVLAATILTPRELGPAFQRRSVWASSVGLDSPMECQAHGCDVVATHQLLIDLPDKGRAYAFNLCPDHYGRMLLKRPPAKVAKRGKWEPVPGAKITPLGTVPDFKLIIQKKGEPPIQQS